MPPQQRSIYPQVPVVLRLRSPAVTSPWRRFFHGSITELCSDQRDSALETTDQPFPREQTRRQGVSVIKLYGCSDPCSFHLRLKPVPKWSQFHSKKNRFYFPGGIDRSLRFPPEEIRLITTSYKWKKHTSNRLVSAAVDLIGTSEELLPRRCVFIQEERTWESVCLCTARSDGRGNVLSSLYNIPVKHSNNIHCPAYETPGLIMKGRQCQSLNSDFPVVSSLGSITSSFIMNSRPLVTADQQGGKRMR